MKHLKTYSLFESFNINDPLYKEKNDIINKWFTAINCNAMDTITELIENGIDINIQDRNGETGLIAAVDNNNIDLVKFFLKNPDVNVNANTKYNKTTALSCAAYAGNKEIVELLLTRSDLDVNMPDKEGKTPLLYAAIFEYKPIVNLLLKHPKIDITVKDNDDNSFIGLVTPYYIMNYDIQKTLIENNPLNINHLIKHNILHPKIKQEYPELFTGAELGLLGENNTKNTSEILTDEEWFSAIENNDIKTVKEYIEQGFDINTIDIDGWSALLYCIRHNNDPILYLLLRQPNIDLTKHPKDWSLLIEAGYQGNSDMIIMLLEHPKIEINVIDENGNNFIDYCLKYSNIDHLNFLNKYELQDKIITNGRLDIISFLYKYNLINQGIKEDYPELAYLFSGMELNLL